MRKVVFPSPTVEERYWSHVDMRGPDECWPWTGARSKGYGKIWVGYDADGKIIMHRATRVGWKLVHGREPGERHVRHTCDNPPCQNPKHWILGTHQRNMDDMAIRGRAKYVRGERHGKSKLTEHQVLSIRSMYTAGYRQADIARHYGVTQANIGEIIKGKTWQHLLG